MAERDEESTFVGTANLDRHIDLAERDSDERMPTTPVSGAPRC